jgi:hypothetical protein
MSLSISVYLIGTIMLLVNPISGIVCLVDCLVVC